MRRSAGKVRIRATFLLIGLLLTGTSGAHAIRNPKQDAVLLEPDGIRLTIDFIVPPGREAQMVREIFDRDHSGAIDAAEQPRLDAFLDKQALLGTKLLVDGVELRLTRLVRRAALGSSVSDALAVHLELSCAALLSDGAHRVVLFDRAKDRRASVPVNVVARGLVVDELPPQPLVFDGHPLELRVRPLERR